MLLDQIDTLDRPDRPAHRPHRRTDRSDPRRPGRRRRRHHRPQRRPRRGRRGAARHRPPRRDPRHRPGRRPGHHRRDRPGHEQFPTAGHLVSWAKLSPRTIQSGPTSRAGRTGKGNPYLKGVLGEAAAAAARTDTFLGERYRRLVKRRGKLKALVAVARSILVIVWHLLADPTARSTTSAPTTTPAASTRTAKPATTSASSKPSATPSPSPRRLTHQRGLRGQLTSIFRLAGTTLGVGGGGAAHKGGSLPRSAARSRNARGVKGVNELAGMLPYLHNRVTSFWIADLRRCLGILRLGRTGAQAPRSSAVGRSARRGHDDPRDEKPPAPPRAGPAGPGGRADGRPP